MIRSRKLEGGCLLVLVAEPCCALLCKTHRKAEHLEAAAFRTVAFMLGRWTASEWAVAQEGFAALLRAAQNKG